jgi:hypothetical protein
MMQEDEWEWFHRIRADFSNGKLDALLAFMQRRKPISAHAAEMIGYTLAVYAGDTSMSPHLVDYELTLTLKKGRPKRSDSYHRVEAAATVAFRMINRPRTGHAQKDENAITRASRRFHVDIASVRKRFREMKKSPFLIAPGVREYYRIERKPK